MRPGGGLRGDFFLPCRLRADGVVAEVVAVAASDDAVGIAMAAIDTLAGEAVDLASAVLFAAAAVEAELAVVFVAAAVEAELAVVVFVAAAVEAELASVGEFVEGLAGDGNRNGFVSSFTVSDATGGSKFN